MPNSLPAFHIEGTGIHSETEIICDLYRKVQALVDNGIQTGTVQISWRIEELDNAKVEEIIVRDGKIQRDLLCEKIRATTEELIIKKD